MRLVTLVFPCLLLLTGCGRNEFSDIEDLRGFIEQAIKDNDSLAITEAFYWGEGDPEIRETMVKMFKPMDFSDFSEVKVTVHQFGDYEPIPNTLGELNGRLLERVHEPSHWIVAQLSQEESEKSSSFKLELPTGQVDGKWVLIGTKYSDKLPMRKVSIPGLTDQHATAIAFDEDAKVTDFVRIKPDSEIEAIDFLAPDDGTNISVVVVGPAVSPELQSRSVVSSKVGEFYLGKVTVQVDEGVVIGIDGNRISSFCPLDADDLKKVRDQILAGETEHSEKVQILRKSE